MPQNERCAIPHSGLSVMGKFRLGVLCGTLAAVSYGLNPLFAVPMYRAGFNTASVLFYRYLFAALLMSGLMLLPGCLKLWKARLSVYPANF